jgi:asparagine synthase (glutamine-hydrolysing)
VKKISIALCSHPSIPWCESESTKIRGFYHDGNGFHEKTEALEHFGAFEDENGFVDRVKTINGNFSVIYETESSIFAAVDRLACFPVYFGVSDTETIISDSVAIASDALNRKEIDPDSLAEYRASGFILSDRTMYKGVSKLESGQYLILDKTDMSLTVKDYYLHLHENISTTSEDELCEELTAVVDDVFSRLIDSVKNRKIVLFLSGGYDSRLVAVTLRKFNYENVLCVTFGRRSDADVIVAEQVAKSCGYPWVLVAEDGAAYWKAKRRSGRLEKRISRAKHDIGHVYRTGLFLEELIENGTIDKDCIAITGAGGDTLEGHLMSLVFSLDKVYTGQDVINAIKNTHFYIDGHKRHTGPMFDKEIGRYLLGRTEFTAAQAEDIHDYFGWHVRYSQREVRDVRNYDSYLGIDWRLPLADNAFADFWAKVPYELRIKRKLYYKWLNVINEDLPSANHVILLSKRVKDRFKKSAHVTRALYFVKAFMNYLLKTSTLQSVIAALKFSEFLSVLKRNKGYRISSLNAVVYLVLKYAYRIK